MNLRRGRQPCAERSGSNRPLLSCGSQERVWILRLLGRRKVGEGGDLSGSLGHCGKGGEPRRTGNEGLCGYGDEREQLLGG